MPVFYPNWIKLNFLKLFVRIFPLIQQHSVVDFSESYACKVYRIAYILPLECSAFEDRLKRFRNIIDPIVIVASAHVVDMRVDVPFAYVVVEQPPYTWVYFGLDVAHATLIA